MPISRRAKKIEDLAIENLTELLQSSSLSDGVKKEIALELLWHSAQMAKSHNADVRNQAGKGKQSGKKKGLSAQEVLERALARQKAKTGETVSA